MSKTILLLGAVAAISGLLIYSQQQSAAVSTLTDVSAENTFFDYIAKFSKHYTDSV